MPAVAHRLTGGNNADHREHPCLWCRRSEVLPGTLSASITEHARSILRWTPLGEWHSEQEIQVVIFGDETCSQWIAFMWCGSEVRRCHKGPARVSAPS